MSKLPAALPPMQLASLPEPLRPRPSLPTRSELRSGDLCPLCQNERLDYDGLLNLACPRCGLLSGGCFT